MSDEYVLALQRQAVLNERRVALAEQRGAELEAAIREHRDRWAGQSTETDDALYAVLEGDK